MASPQSEGFIPQDTPHAFPLTNPRHSLLSYTMHASCLNFISFFFFLNSPSRYHFTSSAADLLSDYPYTPHIDHLSNLVILHSLHMAKPSQNTFMNPFVTPHNYLILAFGTLSIFLIPVIPTLTLSPAHPFRSPSTRNLYHFLLHPQPCLISSRTSPFLHHPSHWGHTPPSHKL